MRVEESVTVEAPRDRVWELVKDPSTYPRLLGGFVVSFDPEDPEQDPAVRARYDMRVKVGSANVGGQVELVEVDEPRDIAWTSITGIEQRGRLRLREAGNGCTKVTMRVSYGAPGAILGTLAELASVNIVRGRIKEGLQALKRQAEGEGDTPLDAPALPARLLHEAVNVGILARSGLVAPMRPDKVARIAWTAARWGASPAMGVLAGAIRHPDRPMVIDDLGSLTYQEVDRHTDAIANALREVGVCEGDRVGLMCRDHRGFVLGVMGVAKVGADVLLLNTSFAKPQLTEVCKREEAAAIIYDEEFAELVEDAGKGRARFVAWHEGEPEDRTLSSLLEAGDPDAVSPPSRAGRVTILTSGTTGTPKGASRGAEGIMTLDPPASLLERIPYREGQVMRIGAPLFHAWGFSNFLLGMALGSTFVLRRRFDAEQCLSDIEEFRCHGLVVVPVMMQRILDLPDEVRERYDTSSLRAVAASGSALPGDLAVRWMDEFGDTLFNMYGSTEVATATLATPTDMRAAPGTAGRPARGTIVRLYDEEGRPVLQGQTGRIFVGNAMLFEGYTGGGGKDVVDGLMATGDVGRFDEAGRLFVQGRDDEMIVSGGENVFPKEVEDTLAEHDGVADVACIGVDDEQFGQRLRCFVVAADGADPSEDELKGHVKERLARYKVPREVVFVDELPRNPTGKVLKRELAEQEG